MTNAGRGCTVIALVNPKCPANVGGVARAISCYDANMLVISGMRFRKFPTDTKKAWRHIPVVETDDVFDAIPYGCVPVAVDLLPDAKPLDKYHHPESAFYIFGPEDRTLGKTITNRCRDKVMIPTRFCMNLAATVNVVLYARCVQRGFPRQGG